METARNYKNILIFKNSKNSQILKIIFKIQKKKDTFEKDFSKINQ